MQIKQGSDPVLKDRIVFSPHAPQTNESSGGKSWLIGTLLIITGLLGSSFYFYPQILPYVEQLRKDYLSDNSTPTVVENNTVTQADTAANIADILQRKPTAEVATEVIPAKTVAEVKAVEEKPAKTVTGITPTPTKVEDKAKVVTETKPIEQKVIIAEKVEEKEPIIATAKPTIKEPVSPPPSSTTKVATSTVKTDTTLADKTATSATESTPITKTEADTLLEKGLAQIASKNLTIPKGDNAYETYQALAKSDPTKAQQILDGIMLWFFNESKNDIKLGKLIAPPRDNAVFFYEKAKALNPEHKGLPAHHDMVLQELNRIIEKQLKRGYISFPVKNNARATYQHLVKFAPNSRTTKNALKQIITGLNDIANKQLKKRHYTTPRGNNAYETYKIILNIDKDNRRAKANIQNLADKYYKFAYDKYKAQSYRSSLSFVNTGLKLVPNHRKLKNLKSSIRKASRDPQSALVSKANREISKGQLSSAYSTYKKLIQAKPNHAKAPGILSEIKKKFTSKARYAFRKKQLQQSLAYINEGLAMFPSHTELKKLKQEILASLSE